MLPAGSQRDRADVADLNRIALQSLDVRADPEVERGWYTPFKLWLVIVLFLLSGTEVQHVQLLL